MIFVSLSLLALIIAVLWFRKEKIKIKQEQAELEAQYRESTRLLEASEEVYRAKSK
jgi:hypothetical protein